MSKPAPKVQKKVARKAPVKAKPKPKAEAGDLRSSVSAGSGDPRRAASKVDQAPIADSPKTSTEPKEGAGPACSLIVKTRAEVAKELKQRVGKGSVRTLNDWFKLGCPNTPGAYNVDEIEQWVRNNIGDDETDDDQSDRAYWTTFHRRELALKAQLERLQTQRQLVEADVVDRLVARLANTLTSMLQQWPDWVLSLLPKVAASERQDIRRAVARKVDELGSLVADMLEEWAEEK